MRNLNTYNKFLESLKPSQFRKYVKEFDKERYADIFKKIGDDYDHDRNYYRVYIPLKKKGIQGFISKTHEKIDKLLKDNDCQIIDYVKGSAKFNGSKNETSIGKILSRLKNEELSKEFISDEKRKSLTSTENEDLLIVISRHPYDIVGSDTDRDWTNCMTIGTDKSNRLTKMMDELSKLEMGTNKYLDLKSKIEDYKQNGVNVKYLIHEVKEGSLISYLIKSNDKNINKPLAVLNIKPYNKKMSDDVGTATTQLHTCKSMYGVHRPEFKEGVQNILDEYFNKESGLYLINPKVYNDDDDFRIFSGDMSTEEFIKIHLNSSLNPSPFEYKINDDDTVDIMGDIRLSSLFNKIPIKFNKVSGNFICHNMALTSLDGCPKEVGGDFDCSHNKLTSLDGCPKKVGGNFNCGCNELTSLDGCPKEVGGDFDCSRNKLKSLEGKPEVIGGVIKARVPRYPGDKNLGDLD